MFRPRRCGDDASTIIDWDNGRMGPSANPMMPRNSKRLRKPETSPERAEHRENRMTAAISSGLRTPRRSDHAPTSVPEIAQANASTEDNMPRWLLLRWSSSAMNGNRKDRARRSKNTKPNVRNNTQSRVFS
ncbi:hypothetical protein D3C75_1005050 [compost metagenome]